MRRSDVVADCHAGSLIATPVNTRRGGGGGGRVEGYVDPPVQGPLLVTTMLGPLSGGGGGWVWVGPKEPIKPL